MAIGFSDSPEYPLRLSIQLHKILNEYNKSKSRIVKTSVYFQITFDHVVCLIHNDRWGFIGLCENVSIQTINHVLGDAFWLHKQLGETSIHIWMKLI